MGGRLFQGLGFSASHRMCLRSAVWLEIRAHARDAELVKAQRALHRGENDYLRDWLGSPGLLTVHSEPCYIRLQMVCVSAPK